MSGKPVTSTTSTALLALLLLRAAPACAQAPEPAGTWAGLANGNARAAVVRGPMPPVQTPIWTRSTDTDGNTIAFIGQAPIAVSGASVFAAGRVSPPGGPANQTRLFAFNRNTGAVRWWMPVPATVLDSDSGPVLDARAGTVVFCSTRQVTAFDQATGLQRWQATLTRTIVNASPLIVNEPGMPGRLFITDYDGFGGAAKLYSINTSPFDATTNPWQPGAIIWSVSLGGSSGNTPAYLPLSEGGIGLVYTASVGDVAGLPGKVLAFDAHGSVAPAPAFVTYNPTPEGFFGGVCLMPPAMNGEHPTLLVASYAFSGGLDAGNLLKLDAATGGITWSAQCNRTQSIPVPLPGGRIALSTGIEGFGSLPALELFQDEGSSATPVWNSAVATWQDNGDGMIGPGEFMPMGGWTHQPVASTFGGKTILSLGLIPASGTFSSPSNELFLLDLDQHPSSVGFIRSHVVGAGGSAAVASQSLISVGTSGLVCYGPTPAMVDVSRNGEIGIDDLYAWESSSGPRDVSGDGLVSSEDRRLLSAALRGVESGHMLRGRP